MTESEQSRRFQTLVLPHLNAAFNLARWLARSDQDAEDVVQEACLRAYKFFDSFQGQGGRVWLLSIVRNTFYGGSVYRKIQAQCVPFDESLHDYAGDMDSSASASPERVLMQRDAARQLEQALEQLPLEFREVIVLRELEDLSYKEIAAIAEIPIGTVMSRLARARKLLAHLLLQEAK